MTVDTTTSRHRTVPIRESMTRIGRGYPDKLVIFQLPASSYWWVRYYTQGKVVKRSTKTQNQREAIEFAKRFYEDILLRERNLLPITKSPTFERCARLLLEEQQHLIDRGERNPKLNDNDRQKLEKDILPFFKGFDIKDVSFKHLNDYLAMLSKRNLAPATLKIHLNLIHKILVLAEREGLLDRTPVMPKIRSKDAPRGHFSEQEYERLKKVTREVIKEGLVARYKQVTDEMRHLITFMVNTFLRPSDVKTLRHRNIEVVEGKHNYLRILTETSKTSRDAVVTMEAAVGIYRDLVQHQQSRGLPCGRDDFVFFPDVTNRDYAMQTMRRQFDAILDRANLKTTASGQPRTLYSLRHTAIMLRLLLGDIDHITLARAARTSPEMIDRFYASGLSAEMNIDKVQSIRKAMNRD